MSKVLTVIIAVLVILVGSAYLLTGSGSDTELEGSARDTGMLDRDEVVPSTEEEPVERREIPAPAPDLVESYSLSGDLPSIDDSDEAILNHLGLVVTPVALQLFNDDQFIRKLVLQVDNAARGELIYAHSPFAGPETGIDVTEENGGELEINPQSYARYDAYAELAETVDTPLLVAYYQFYEPLLDEAYTELGYPEGEFRSVLIKAIDQVLSAPVVEGEIALAQPEANYVFEEASLEGLNMLQKQLLRMGPENTQRVQMVLQRFKSRIQ